MRRRRQGDAVAFAYAGASQALGELDEACQQRGMDRAGFNEWKSRFQSLSFEGHTDPQPINVSHPRTASPETVEMIKVPAFACPTSGCNRRELILALVGIRVSSIAIQKIFQEHALGHKIDRRLALGQ